jgi:hypothetical protein
MSTFAMGRRGHRSRLSEMAGVRVAPRTSTRRLESVRARSSSQCRNGIGGRYQQSTGRCATWPPGWRQPTNVP